jgi:hypothetical protein
MSTNDERGKEKMFCGMTKWMHIKKKEEWNPYPVITV